MPRPRALSTPAAGGVAVFIAALLAFVEVAQSWHLPSQVVVSRLSAARDIYCSSVTHQTLSATTSRLTALPAAAFHLDIRAMPLTRERALEIRDECFADDVPLPPDTCRWDAEELEQYLCTGGEWLPAWRTAPMKVLCLHGGGVNSKVMEYQTGNLRRALGDKTHFEYLNGPREWADPVDPRLLRFFGDGPYFGWYGVSDDADPSRAHTDKLLDETITFTYEQVEEGLDYVEAKIQASGPFDAIMGFSQGSIVATMLTARAMARHTAGDGPGPTWRHVLLFSGMPPRDSGYVRATPQKAICHFYRSFDIFAHKSLPRAGEEQFMSSFKQEVEFCTALISSSDITSEIGVLAPCSF
uniref:Serine hydrolase domain-containing protein n=1 Tax=Chrysotila carterae TaxID=13221 RepID=A0A7S4BID9_CHRCT